MDVDVDGVALRDALTPILEHLRGMSCWRSEIPLESIQSTDGDGADWLLEGAENAELWTDTVRPMLERLKPQLVKAHLQVAATAGVSRVVNQWGCTSATETLIRAASSSSSYWLAMAGQDGTLARAATADELRRLHPHAIKEVERLVALDGQTLDSLEAIAIQELTLVEGSLISPKSRSMSALSATDEAGAGPAGVDGWRVGPGVVKGLKGKPFRLAAFLWRAANKTAHLDEIAECVNDGFANLTTVKKWQSVANKFFRDNSIPWRVRTANELFTIEQARTD